MSANTDPDPEFQPDLVDVLQIEGAFGTEPPVNVKVNGPVRTQELPSKAGATFTKVVTTAPIKLLFSDHRRSRATIISVGQNMLVAFSSAAAQDSSRMALWPANLPYTHLGGTELWVASATTTTAVSVLTSLWATGEDGRN
jgi:hypothetical protein